MADFSFPGGAYDIEGSINLFIKNNILLNMPTWAQNIQINYDYPNQPLIYPAFAIVHMPSDEYPGLHHMGDVADGSNKGVTMLGSFEIDCFVDSTNNTEWVMQLRQMRDMIYKLFRQNSAIQIKNLYTTGIAAPTDSGTVIRIESITGKYVLPDPISQTAKRRRILVKYRYEMRF